MQTWRRRTGYYLVTLFLVMSSYSVAYHWGMVHLEGESVAFLHSVQVVVETFTTTGFGSDAPWQSTGMNALVILMDLTGVALIFLALPVLVFPLFEEAMETSAPTTTDAADHVVVCGYTSRGQALVDELRARDRPFVVVEPDRERADELYDDGLPAIYANPETREGLAAANVEAAHAVVADVDDETNASIVLTARDAGDAPVVTFVEDATLEPYHWYAGASEVFSPRQLIGQSIARKVTPPVTPRLEGGDVGGDRTALSDAVEIADDFDVVELPVQDGSELAGLTIADSGIRERVGANVVGAWFRGEFVSPPPPEARIDEQTILVVAGRERQLQRLQSLARAERSGRRDGPVIVAGYGGVGSTVVENIDDARTTVVDRQDGEGVDVVGDVTDEETLEAAGVHEASTVVLALSDDTETVFATLVIREVDPDVEIVARADATGSVRKLYQAGADYVLALATVSGRMLASSLLDEEVISYDQQVEVIRVGPGALAGRTLAGADVRARTGCTIIAVERDGELVTELTADFRVQAGDELVVAGTDADINRFAGQFE